MSPQSSQFPIYLKPTLDGPGTRAAFSQFEAAATASAKAAGNALKAGVQGGRIDLNTAGLKQSITDAQLAARAFQDVRTAAAAVARQTGDTSQSTQEFIRSIQQQEAAQQRLIQSGQEELAFYSRIQASLNATASDQSRLAQLYGATEQGKQAALARTKAVMQESARASQQYEAELRELIAVTNPAALAQEKLAQSILLADRALARGDLSADTHAQAVTRLSNVYGNMAGTMGVTRQATVQAGQQIQDIGISLYSGQQAAVVFAQQIPQLAFVLSSLEGSANKTHNRIGQFATFLAGPWGLLVGVAAGALVYLVSELFKTGDAADKAKGKTYDFSQGLNILTLSAKESVNAMQQLADATKGATRAQADFLDQQNLVARQSIATLEGRINQRNVRIAELSKGLGGIFSDNNLGDFAERAGLRRDNKPDIEALKLARQAQLNADIATAQRRVNEELDAGTAATGRYARAIGELDARRTQTVNFPGGEAGGVAQQVLGARFISAADYEKEYRRLTLLKKAAEEAERASKRTTRSKQQVFEDFRRELSERGIQQAAGRTGFRSASDQAEIFRSGQSPLDGLRRVSRHQSYQALDPTRASHDDAAARAAAQAAGLKGFKIVSESGGRKHYEWRGAGDAGEVDVSGAERDAARATAAAERQARELEKLADFGNNAANSIAGISSQFDDQPRLIDAAAAAARRLDDIMAELSKREPEGFAKLLADAQRAKDLALDAPNKPLRELKKEAQEQAALDNLRIEGRTFEAELLTRTLSLQQRGGVINQEVIADLGEIMALEQRRGIELEKQNDTLERNMRIVDGTRENVRQGIRDILGGKGFASIGDAFKRQFDLYLDGLADQFSEQLFGDVFREQKLKLLGLDKVDEAGQDMAKRVNEVADELGRLTSALSQASNAISPANDNSLTGQFDAASGAGAINKANNDIVITGLRKSAMSVERTMTSTLDGFFGQIFGSSAAERITQGMMAAATGGALGGMLGGRTGQGIGSGIGGLLGLVSGGQGGIGKLLTSLQSQLPVIGAALSVNQGLNTLFGNDDREGGKLLHTVLGPFASLLFKKKSGSSTVSSLDGNLSYSGNKGYRDGVLGSAGNVQSSLARISEALGGTAGAFRVSIGQRGKDFTVDPTGAGRTKGSGVLKFKTEEEAIRAALADALRDGAIAGISAGMQRLIQGGKDLDAQLAKAVKLQDVFDRLKQIDDPLGYAISVIDREFASLRKIAAEAGEGMAEVERLYGIERLKVVKETNERITASLRDLYDELTISNSALSLRDRKGAAQAKYNPLAERVRAGDTTAYDDFAKAARELLSIERELSGSQSGYFSLLSEVTDLTKARLDASASPAAANDNPAVVFAIGQLGSFIVDGLGAQLTAVNQNLGALIAQGFGGGGGGNFNFSSAQTF